MFNSILKVYCFVPDVFFLFKNGAFQITAKPSVTCRPAAKLGKFINLRNKQFHSDK